MTSQRATAAGDLQVATVGSARVLTLNRPVRRNALTPELGSALGRELDAAARDAGLRAVVLRGAGGHFCVGLDLKWFASLGVDPGAAALQQGLSEFQQCVHTIVACPLPVVAALEGSVAGFGLDLALACDIRVAADTLAVSSSFARMGLIPDGGSTYTLARLVGPEWAARIHLAGEAVDAQRAEAIGLVSRVTAPHGLEDAVAELVAEIARGGRESVARIKRLLRDDERTALATRLAAEGTAQIEALGSAEFRERLRRFLGRGEGEGR